MSSEDADKCQVEPPSSDDPGHEHTIILKTMLLFMVSLEA